MANVTYTVANKNGSYDGDMVVKQYSSITVDSGDTVTTDQPCRGLLLYSQGNVTINGTITMTKRGASADPATSGGSDSSATNSNGLLIPYNKTGGASYSVTPALAGCGTEAVSVVANHPSSGTGYVLQVPRAGGSGGSGVNPGISGTSNGGNGGNGVSGTISSTVYKQVTLGGGAAGGKYSDNNSCGGNSSGNSGSGGTATCWSGGPGGGGKMSGTQPSNSGATSGSNTGGAGGNAGNGHCGGPHSTTGGIGNPTGRDMYNNTNNGGVTFGNVAWSTLGGTGGLLMIISGGNVTIGGTGSVTANGITQDNGISNGNYTRSQGGLYGGGGSSGAGAIVILHKGTYSNSGTVQASGGSQVSNAGTAGNGGVFTETID